MRMTPPFYSIEEELCDRELICCLIILLYAVIGGKICVSTEKDAYAHDIKANKWETYNLFLGEEKSSEALYYRG